MFLVLHRKLRLGILMLSLEVLLSWQAKRFVDLEV